MTPYLVVKIPLREVEGVLCEHCGGRLYKPAGVMDGESQFVFCLEPGCGPNTEDPRWAAARCPACGSGNFGHEKPENAATVTLCGNGQDHFRGWVPSVRGMTLDAELVHLQRE